MQKTNIFILFVIGPFYYGKECNKKTFSVLDCFHNLLLTLQTIENNLFVFLNVELRSVYILSYPDPTCEIILVLLLLALQNLVKERLFFKFICQHNYQYIMDLNSSKWKSGLSPSRLEFSACKFTQKPVPSSHLHGRAHTRTRKIYHQ